MKTVQKINHNYMAVDSFRQEEFRKMFINLKENILEWPMGFFEKLYDSCGSSMVYTDLIDLLHQPNVDEAEVVRLIHIFIEELSMENPQI